MTKGVLADRLRGILDRGAWQNAAAQVKARAYLRELGLNDNLQWRYNPQDVLRSASLLQLLAGRLDATAEVHDISKLGRLWEAIGKLDDYAAPNSSILAALAYEAAGSPASSAAVMRKLGRLERFRDDVVLHATELLLSRRLIKLRVVLNSLSEGEYDSLGIIDVGLLDAIEEFAEYLLSGDTGRLDCARETLDELASVTGQLGEVRNYLLASGLRHLTEIVEPRSIWHLLGEYRSETDVLWQRYLQLLARGQGRDILDGHSITEIWPSQKRAIARGLLDTSIGSLAIRMPTSSGKTRVAELAIVRSLTQFPDSKVIYIAPYRALANEILISFRRLLSDLGFSVASATGSYEYDALEEELLEDADVSVLTPERLDLLLRINRSALDRIRLVVIDEGQILETGMRGIKTELLLTRLRRILSGARFVIASAIIGEESLTEISEWLAQRDQPSSVAVSRWRPSLQQVAKFEWKASSGFLYLYDDPTSDTADTFLPGVLRRRTISYVKEETRRRNTRKFPIDKADTAAELSLKMSRLGPVLIYVAQPNWTLSVARRIEELVSIEPESRPDWWGNIPGGPGRAEQIAADWSSDNHLNRLLSKGVAIHHGDLPEALKEAIERDARDYRFRIIVATGTLSSGVNIPIRTVIIHSYIRFDEERQRPSWMPAADYWNIAGRAGRAGYESEGLVIHIVESDDDAMALANYREFPARGAPLKSQLLDIARRIESRLLTINEAGELLDPEILALAAEEDTLEGAEVQIEQILHDSLAAKQAPSANISLANVNAAMRSQARSIFERAPEGAWRLAFAQTGIPSSECLQIKQSLDAAPEIREILLDGGPVNLVTALLPVILRVGPLVDIGTTAAVTIDAMTAWINGDPVASVVDKLMDDGLTAERAQRTIDRYFRYYTPWYLSAAIRIAAATFGDALQGYALSTRFLPAIVRSGVPTLSSCYAVAVGIPTRKIAIAVADEFDRDSDGESSRFVDFRNWLSSLGRDAFSTRFGLSGAFLQDFYDTIQALARRDIVIDSLRNDDVLPRTVRVPVLQTREAIHAVRQLAIGDEVRCERSYVDLLDRNAVELVAGDVTIGQLGDVEGRLLAVELDSGRSLRTTVVGLSQDGAAIKVQIE